MTASEMFNVPVEGMPREVRRRAKAINFGIIYGISAFGLANQLSIPREEAGDYIKRYFERFPGIRDYMEGDQGVRARARLCRNDLRPPRRTIRKSARPTRRSAPTTSAPRSTRRSRARPPTSSAAPWCAWTTALDEAGLSDVRMLLQVHDELIFEAPSRDVEAAMPVIRTVMENAAMPAVSLSVPLQVDARAADNWDEAH